MFCPVEQLRVKREIHRVLQRGVLDESPAPDESRAVDDQIESNLVLVIAEPVAGILPGSPVQVYGSDLVPVLLQAGDKVTPDEPGTAGHEDPHLPNSFR